jgi:hypothetical protein
MQAPQRPFESLDWYREAQGGHDDEHPWLSRARSFSAVRAHISLFAVGSVLLLAINLMRAPGNVGADRWIAIWGLIVIMHAVVTGIAWLVMQLIAADDELRPASEVRWDPMRTWRLPTAAPGTPFVGPIPLIDQAMPTNGVAPDPQVGMATEPPPPSGWRTVEPEQAAPVSSERASWSEAAAAAWLARGHQTGQDDGAPPADAGTDAFTSSDGSDDSLSGREPHARYPL